MSPFSGWSPRQAGSTSPECSWRPHLLRLAASVRLAPCEPSPSDSVLPRRPSVPTHVRHALTPNRRVAAPTCGSCVPQRSACADHPSCGSSPVSSCVLVPLGLRSGSASRLTPVLLPRFRPVGQIVVRSGVLSSCVEQSTWSRGIFEITGLSTEKAVNPQKHSVHPPSAHRLHTAPHLFTGSVGCRSGGSG